MTDKPKDKDTPEAAKPKEAPTPPITIDIVMDALKGASAEKRTELGKLLGMTKPIDVHAGAPSSAEKPHSAEKAPEHGEKEKDTEHDKEKHGEHEDTGPVHGKDILPFPGKERGTPEPHPAAMTGKEKVATLGAAGALSTAATLAGAGVAMPEFLRTYVYANVLYGGLSSLAAPAIAAYGFWPTILGIAPAAALGGLYAVGKVSNLIMRAGYGIVNFFRDKKLEHKNTGWGMKNLWYGAKALTSPIWAPIWGAGLLAKKAFKGVQMNVGPWMQRLGHELRHAVKWTAIGGLGLSAFTVLAYGLLPTLAGAVGGGFALGYLGNAGYRAWQRWVNQRGSTLGQTAGSHGHDAGHGDGHPQTLPFPQQGGHGDAGHAQAA